MCLTIDELSPTFMRSQEISPARSDQTGLGPLCATVFAPRLAPCPGLAWDGALAAVSLARAWVQQQGVMGSRLRWEAALDHPPGPQPPGTRGPTPAQGTRQRSVHAWARRSDTPWDPGEVDGYGGQRTPLGGCSHTALWDTLGLPPGASRDVLVGAPEGQRRREAFFGPDPQATPGPLLEGVVMRWSVEVTGEEARAPLGLETPRQWSDRALVRTTPDLLAVCSLVTVLALPLRQDGQSPVPTTAWYHNAEPTVTDGLVLVRQHLWRARSVVHAAPEPEFGQFPRETFALLLTGLP
jgi:hypothetical protein